MGVPALLAWSFLAMALDIGVSRITYGTILPALSRDLGLDYATGGLLGAANLAAYLAGTLAAPSLGRRFGMRRLASVGHLGFAAGALLCGAAGGIPLFAAGRVIMGFGSGIGLLALFVLIFASVPTERRPVASAFVWGGIGFSVILSGLAAPWLLEPGGWWRLSLFGPALAGLAVGLSVARPVAAHAGPPPASAMPAAGAAGPLRHHLPLAAAYFMFGAGYIAYATFAGAKLAAEAAPLSVVVGSWLTLGAAALAGSACTAALLSWPRPRSLALLASLVTGALGSLAAGIGGAAFSLAASVLIGLGLASTPAVVTAYARERTSDSDYPRVFGFATAGLGLGQLIGPVAAGLLAGRFGSGSVMGFAALAYLTGAGLAVLDLRRSVQVQSGPVTAGTSSRAPHSDQEPS